MVHAYQMNGYRIALDVNSGAIHVVDEPVFRLLPLYPDHSLDEATRLLPEFSGEDLREAWEEIGQLAENGLMFTPDPPEEGPFDRQPIVKALCLHVAHACNLRCRYCFAGDGEYGARSPALMSLETGKKAIDYLIRDSGSRRNLEVDFFGGEPTLNMETVKGVVAYGREQEKLHRKNIRFTLTTNGVLLTEELDDYLFENMQNLVLSLDGRPAVQDRMRKNLSGGGSYDQIMPNLLRAARRRGNRGYYVRGTFTRENLDFAADALHLADLGFTQISLEPVVAGPAENYALREEDLPALLTEYEKLAVAMLRRERQGRGFNFFHFMIDLAGGPCAAKRAAGCGAGTEYLAVTPQGDLYPCHQFVGQECFRLGNLEQGVANQELYRRFDACNIRNKPACRGCWAKYYCSGGCAANAFHQSGDLLTPYAVGCALQKKRLECAVMMKAAKEMQMPESDIPVNGGNHC